MAGLLLIMIIVTDVILVLIAVKAYRLGTRIRTRAAQLQATIVILLCVGGLIASVQDIGIQLTELGWLSQSTGRHFVRGLHVVLVVGALVFLVPVLYVLQQLTGEFARAEAVVSALVDRLPPELTVESAALTKREEEVVLAIGDGHVSDREIAEHLVISPATAATHVRNIMKKTGVKRRGDLMLLALELEPA